jgi:hypothetical protein
MDMRPVNNATIADENKSPLQDITRERLRGAKFFMRRPNEPESILTPNNTYASKIELRPIN